MVIETEPKEETNFNVLFLTYSAFLRDILTASHSRGYIRNINNVFQINRPNYLMYKARNENQTKQKKNIIPRFKTRHYDNILVLK
jgi:hypothetical protein